VLDEVATTGIDGKTSKFSQPNIYLFTKGHFSSIRVEGDKPRSTDPWMSMTRDQVIDTWIKQFTASGGTYDMKGGTLTMKTTIAKNPAFMARANWISYTVKINGQTMTLTATATNEGPIKNPQIMTLTPPRLTVCPTRRTLGTGKEEGLRLRSRGRRAVIVDDEPFARAFHPDMARAEAK
jgi:hypothetical protein